MVIWKVSREVTPTITLRFLFWGATASSLVSLPYSSEQVVHLKALYLVIYLFKVIWKISLSSLCNLLSKFLSVLFCFFPPFLLSFLGTIYHPCLFDFLLYPYFYPAIYPMKSHSYSCDCVQNYYVFLGYSPCSWYFCAIFKGFHQIVQLFSCVSPSPYCS